MKYTDFQATNWIMSQKSVRTHDSMIWNYLPWVVLIFITVEEVEWHNTILIRMRDEKLQNANSSNAQLGFNDLCDARA